MRVLKYYIKINNFFWRENRVNKKPRNILLWGINTYVKQWKSYSSLGQTYKPTIIQTWFQTYRKQVVNPQHQTPQG